MDMSKGVTSRPGIGALLKSQREMLNLSQRQIAIRLGYECFNYISMLETGSSKIPLAKIPQIG